jgi:hypothetical protein
MFLDNQPSEIRHKTGQSWAATCPPLPTEPVASDIRYGSVPTGSVLEWDSSSPESQNPATNVACFEGGGTLLTDGVLQMRMGTVLHSSVMVWAGCPVD